MYFRDMRSARIQSGCFVVFLALFVTGGAACSSRAQRGDAGNGGGAGGGLGAGGDMGTGGAASAGGESGAGGGPVGHGGAEFVAKIVTSASTNSRSMQVDVYADASAERTVGPPSMVEMAIDAGLNPLDGTPKTFPAGSADVVTFVQALAAVGDLSSLPILSLCTKSISFGTTTKVTAAGITSGDLQCIDAKSDAGDVAAATALFQAAQQLTTVK